MVERYVRDVEVAGSNPVTPIFLLGYRKALGYGLCGFSFTFLSCCFCMKIKYEETESYQVTEMFINNREYLLERLLGTLN